MSMRLGWIRFQKPPHNRGCNLLILRSQNKQCEPYRKELFLEHLSRPS